MTIITGRLESALAGRYRLERELDTGGMAVVYAATDLRHKRHVAIKVLRPELSAVLGAERFDAEIRISANLQHPHILPLFDSGSADGLLFYVMPLVEGASLRARLTREKQLSFDEAVSIATQVAHALEYAHAHGVIHRDIKPENILLQGGDVLVADFGIALALEQSGGSRLTQTGLSLGTPHYMSPEQATGERSLDARTDIYSIGVVLYEMLAGAPPFTGPTVQAIIARIVTENARSISELRQSTPPHVAATLERALARIPADRFARAQEFADALANPLFRGTLLQRNAASVPARRSGVDRLLTNASGQLSVARTGIVLAVVAAAGAVVGTLLDRQPNDTGVSATVRLAIPTTSPQFDRLLGQLPLLALSPDGKALVFAQDGRLNVRRLDAFESRALPGTEDAIVPAFSPDGRWIVFGQSGRVRKVSMEGGPIVDIATATPYRLGAYWADDDHIYFSAGLGDRGIWRVKASGGTPEPVTMLVDSLGEQAHGWPQVLPGGRDILYTILGATASANDSRIVVERIGSGERTTLVDHATFGRFVKSGQILYGTINGAVYSVPYDVSRREVTANAVAAADGVTLAVWGGGTLFAASDGGTLAYVPGSANDYHTMLFVDRTGRVIQQLGPPRNVRGAMFAPDGRRVAVTVREPGKNDVWLFRAERSDAERFTLESAENEMPVWSPDGERIAYRSAKSGGAHGLLMKGVVAHTEPQVLRIWSRHIHLTSWNADGKWLAAYDYHPVNNEDVWALAATGKDSMAVAKGPARELNGTFSPNGKWLAYQSDESGRFEVYVVSFPQLSSKRQVSTNGGSVPRWDGTGSALYFLERGRLVSVSLNMRSGFEINGAPQPMFATTAFDYDVSPDGRRFLLEIPNSAAPTPAIRVIVNWSRNSLAASPDTRP